MAIKLTYHWEGDYLIPDLTPPPEPKIGVWGRRRKRYLQQHREPIYTGMLLSGSLNAHLEEIDKQAEKMLDLLMEQMAPREGVTEKLKAENQLEWVKKMNNIQIILVSIKKLEKLFIAPKARLRLHETV